MFEKYNNILAIHAAALYNKPMYDAIVSLSKEVKEYFNEGYQQQFIEAKSELNKLKQDYKTHPATFLTRDNYKQKKTRKQITALTTGGNGRVALVEWMSLSDKLRERIISYVGYDPAKEYGKRKFIDTIVTDNKAQAYYANPNNTQGEIGRASCRERVYAPV